ncbi:hypothetical protein FOZ63_000994, partial [Perkinsus olseni]
PVGFVLFTCNVVQYEGTRLDMLDRISVEPLVLVALFLCQLGVPCVYADRHWASGDELGLARMLLMCVRVQRPIEKVSGESGIDDLYKLHRLQVNLHCRSDILNLY